MSDKKNTPAAEVNAPAAEQNAPRNRYRDLFEAIHFQPSESDQVYTNDRDGSQSKRIASALVVLRGGFAAVPATVYARKPKQGKVYAEVTFMGTRQQTAIKALDEPSKAELQEFRQWMAREFAEWRKGQNISAAARVNVGVEVDNISFD